MAVNPTISLKQIVTESKLSAGTCINSTYTYGEKESPMRDGKRPRHSTHRIWAFNYCVCPFHSLDTKSIQSWRTALCIYIELEARAVSPGLRQHKMFGGLKVSVTKEPPSKVRWEKETDTERERELTSLWKTNTHASIGGTQQRRSRSAHKLISASLFTMTQRSERATSNEPVSSV